MFNLINLAFILVIIPWRMVPLALSRGRSAAGWTLGAIGAWIATTLVIAIGYIPIQSLGAFSLGWSADTLRTGLIVARGVAVASSFAVFELLRRRLATKTNAPAMSPQQVGQKSE
jgi:hypothetical protein